MAGSASISGVLQQSRMSRPGWRVRVLNVRLKFGERNDFPPWKTVTTMSLQKKFASASRRVLKLVTSSLSEPSCNGRGRNR